MRAVVRHGYRAADLPEELRRDFDPAARVDVIVFEQAEASKAPPLMSFFGAGSRPLFTPEDVDRHLGALRSEWT